MRSQLSEEEICSGMWASGNFAVVADGDEGADGDLLLAVWRCTSISKAMKVTARRSASVPWGQRQAGAGPVRFDCWCRRSRRWSGKR